MLLVLGVPVPGAADPADGTEPQDRQATAEITEDDSVRALEGRWDGWIETTRSDGSVTERQAVRVEWHVTAEHLVRRIEAREGDAGWSAMRVETGPGPVGARVTVHEFADGESMRAVYRVVERDLESRDAWRFVLEPHDPDAAAVESVRVRVVRSLRDGVFEERVEEFAAASADGEPTPIVRRRLRAERAAVEADALIGTWSVDLRPTPDAEPYLQRFRVDSVDDGRLTGRFYGTRITDGRIDVAWGRVEFAFTTRDGSGVYHTSGHLETDGTLVGRTHSPSRGFLQPWRAEHED